MRELIDKAVVAAEIKRRINGLKDCHADTVSGYAGEISGLERLLSFLDTLEVKEIGVDLGVPQGDKSTKYIIDIKTFEVRDVEEEPISEDLEEAAKKAGQKYFPNEYNIWARPNYEAKAAEYAFKEGAQWQKEQMIDKACEWLKSYRQDTPDGTGYISGIVNDKTIKEFKQAMEE